MDDQSVQACLQLNHLELYAPRSANGAPEAEEVRIPKLIAKTKKQKAENVASEKANENGASVSETSCLVQPNSYTEETLPSDLSVNNLTMNTLGCYVGSVDTAERPSTEALDKN